MRYVNERSLVTVCAVVSVALLLLQSPSALDLAARAFTVASVALVALDYGDFLGSRRGWTVRVDTMDEVTGAVREGAPVSLSRGDSLAVGDKRTRDEGVRHAVVVTRDGFRSIVFAVRSEDVPKWGSAADVVRETVQ